MKRITVTHKVTGLQISVLSDSESLRATFTDSLKESGVTVLNWNDWTGDVWPLWPQKA